VSLLVLIRVGCFPNSALLANRHREGKKSRTWLSRKTKITGVYVIAKAGPPLSLFLLPA
jgi:hypothetical protein